VSPPSLRIRARGFYSLDTASDGCVYYTLSSHNIDTHGRVYRYDPKTDEVKLMCDLGEAAGETGLKALPQGKSHSPFYELDGWLYFATHYGFFAASSSNGEFKEQRAAVPEGYKPYRGGHVLRLNLKTGETENLACTNAEEGIITFNMDAQRRRMYGLTWPTGFFLVYDIESRKLRNLGPVCRDGENGLGDQYFCLVRSFAIDPRDGHVYFTNADGQVYCYSPETDRVEPFAEVTLKRDILGQWDPHKPGHQGYNWRDTVWHEEDQCFYGVHPKSGWLFLFDPPNKRLELLDRIAAEDLLRTGQYEPFRYGYLTLKLGPDRKTLYYLTSTYGAEDAAGTVTPVAHLLTPSVLAKHNTDQHNLKLADGRLVVEVTHLITYDLRRGKYTDHGALQLEDGRPIRMSQCLAVHPNGTCYACPWIQTSRRSPQGHMIWQCDLISFKTPGSRKK
jgi:hypothetical protein